jgi:hypothetical protein
LNADAAWVTFPVKSTGSLATLVPPVAGSPVLGE